MKCNQPVANLKAIGVVGGILSAILLLLYFKPLAAQTGEWLILSEEQGEYPLGLHLAYLEDVDKVWTIEDVSGGEVNGRFQASTDPIPNFGFTDSAYWVQLHLQSNVPMITTWYLEADANMNYIDLYIPNQDTTQFTYQRIGNLLPFSVREVSHHNLVFQFQLPPQSQQTIYLRFENQAAMQIDLTLWSPQAFTQKIYGELLVLGLFYSALLTSIGYNLFLYFSLHDKSYLYLCLFAVSLLLTFLSLDGVANRYLWSNVPQWNYFSTLLFGVFAVIFASQFTSTFLTTSQNLPKLHKVMRILQIGLVMLCPFFLFLPRIAMAIPMLSLMMASTVMLFVAGFLMWRQDSQIARYYLLAWAMFLVTAVAMMLSRLGLLPVTFFTQEGVRVGIVLLILLLSLALADRINLLQQEKGEAFAQAQQANEQLEQSVARRTAELAQATADLSEQGSKIESLRQLGLEVTSELELDTLLQAIVTRAAELAGSDRGGLFLWQDDKQALELVAVVGNPRIPLGTTIQPGHGLTGQVWQTGQTKSVVDYVTWHERLDEFAGHLPQTAMVGVPVRWRDEPQGVLTILDESGRVFTDEDIELLRLFAAQTAVALQNARLINQAQKYTQQLEAEIFERRQVEASLKHYRDHLEDLVEQRTTELKEANQQLEQEIQERIQIENRLRRRNRILLALQSANLIVSSSLDLQEVLNIVAREMASLFGISICDILTWNPDTNVMVMVAGYRHPRYLDDSEMEEFNLNEYPLTEKVLRQKVVAQMTISQPDIDPDEYRYMVNEGSKTLLMIPLVFHNETIGLVTLEDYHEERVFTDEEISLAQLLTHQAANAIQNARSYRQAQQLIGELESKNSELERFTYTVSHDLKSPLVTVQGFLGYLERDALKGDMTRLRSDIEHIRTASNQMKLLLEDLLELSRIGRVMNKPERVKFNSLVDEAVQLIGGYTQEREIEIIIMPDMPVVYGDRARLVEVLQNLLDNAVKFMGEQPEPRIEIGFEAGGTPIFFVRDNGVGIEPQYQDKVFGLFDRLDQNVEGTGIGLALVKRIVELHNGRIWIESDGKGQGSTFYFTLPAEELE